MYKTNTHTHTLTHSANTCQLTDRQWRQWHTSQFLTINRLLDVQYFFNVGPCSSPAHKHNHIVKNSECCCICKFDIRPGVKSWSWRLGLEMLFCFLKQKVSVSGLKGLVLQGHFQRQNFSEVSNGNKLSLHLISSARCSCSVFFTPSTR